MAAKPHTLRASHRHLAKGAAAYAGARGVSSILSLVIMAVLSRHLNTVEFGAWAVLVAAFQLVTSSDLGFTAGVRMRVVKLLARDNTENAIRTYLQSSLILGGFCLVLGLIALPIVPLTQLLALPSTPAMRLAAWIAVEAALVSLPVGIAANLFFSYMEAATVSALEIFRSLAQSGLISISILLHAPFVFLVIVYYGAYLLATGLGLYLFIKRRHIGLHHLTIYRHANLRLMLRWLGRMLSRSLLFCIAAMAYSFTLNGGAIIISHLMSVKFVGDYSILMRIMGAGLALHAALLASYSGGYGTHYHGGNLAWVRRSLLLFCGVTTLGWLIGSAVLIFEGPWIIHLWFGRWITDERLIVAVSAWALILGLYQVFWGFLQSAGHVRLQAVLGIFFASANIGLAAIWVPYAGVSGAVWASCVATGFWLLLTFAEATYRLGPKHPPLAGRPEVTAK